MRLLSLMALVACGPIVVDDPELPPDTDVPDPEPARWTEWPGELDGMSWPGTRFERPEVEATVEISTHPEHPLLAVVVVRAARQTGLLVTIDGPGVEAREASDDRYSSVHRYVVAGLRADSTYDITVRVAADGSRDKVVHGEIRTGPLPFDLPHLEVAVPGDPEGYLLLGITEEVPRPHGVETVYVALDAEGEVVWFLRSPGSPTMIPLIRPGPDRTFQALYLDEIREVDIEGRVLHRQMRSGGEEPWHHDAVILPDHSTLALSDEERFVPDVGTVVGDVVVEYGEGGRVRRRWSALDTLPLRFPGPLSETPYARGIDWSHGNAITPTPDRRAFLASLRSQSQVVRVDRLTGEPDWALGQGGDFQLLEGEWFNAQHAPYYVDDDTLMIYDNGNERFEAGGAGSRVVVYDLDEEALQARQVWAWDVPVYTPFVGSARPWRDGAVVCAGAPVDGVASIYVVDGAGEIEWSVEVGELVYRAELVSDL